MSPREFRPDPKPAKQVTGEKVALPGGKVGLKRARMAEATVEVVSEEPEWRRMAAAPLAPVTDGGRPSGERYKTAAEKREERHRRVQERVRMRAEEIEARRRGEQ